MTDPCLSLANDRRSELTTAKLVTLGELTAGVVHELSTPLQYVTDNLAFLEESFDELLRSFDEDTAGAGIDDLRKEVPEAARDARLGLDRARKILEAVRRFSHPGDEQKVPLDVNSAIEQAATLTRNSWKHIAELEFELSTELPRVLANGDQIQQVVVNFIVNAAQSIHAAWTDDGSPRPMGRIAIFSRFDSGNILIEVQDSGLGLPAGNTHRLFEPFVTTKAPGKGTGQGLAIASKIIVDEHGGKLGCRPAAEGGAVFWFTLPAGEES